jgi:diadenosine tetraphosphate (Ap4A) HIT family hydrolase
MRVAQKKDRWHLPIDMSEPFELHPQLAADTIQVIDWPICRVLLMNDARFPWLILVPRKADLRDFDDVSPADKSAFYAEIERASQILRAATSAKKMNVAALGNMVPQLHVHVVARFSNDEAWPAPVWGVGKAVPYAPEVADALIKQVINGADNHG